MINHRDHDTWNETGWHLHPCFPGVCCLENFTVDLILLWFTQLCMESDQWKFTKVSTAVHDNIFGVLIAWLVSYLYSWLLSTLLYLHHGTSHIVNNFTGGFWPVIFFYSSTWENGINCPFCFEDSVFVTHGSQVHYFWLSCTRQIGSCWQFAGWISAIPVRPVILILMNHILLLLSKYGV